MRVVQNLDSHFLLAVQKRINGQGSTYLHERLRCQKAWFHHKNFPCRHISSAEEIEYEPESKGSHEYSVIIISERQSMICPPVWRDKPRA